jgi:O-antigen/teichoic acid export membrane protein
MRIVRRKLFPESRFARNVSVIVGGTGTAQAIILLSSPILTRLFTPDGFGLMAVYVSLLSIVGGVASLRYQIAIPLPERAQDAFSILVLSFMLTAASAAASLLAVVLCRDQIAIAMGEPEIAGLLFLLPIGVLLYGSYEILNYWAIRARAFPDISRTKVTKALTTVVTQIATSVLGPIALILGQVAGYGAGILKLGRLVYRDARHGLLKHPFRGVNSAAYRYRNLPSYATWAELLGTASTSLPLILIAVLFSSAAAGLYSIAQRVLNQPMVMIGQAVSDVFLADAVEARRRGELGTRTLKVHLILARLGMPIVLVLFLAGERLFAVAFGPQWADAGRLAAYLSPWMYLKFTAAPITSVVTVLEHQRLNAFLNTVAIFVRVLVIVIAALYLTLDQTIAVFGLVNVLLVIALLYYIFAKLGIAVRHWFAPHLTFFLLGLIIFSGPTLLTAAYSNHWSLPLLALGVSLIAYYAYQGLWLIKQVR